MCDNIVNHYAKNSENSTYSRSQEILRILVFGLSCARKYSKSEITRGSKLDWDQGGLETKESLGSHKIWGPRKLEEYETSRAKGSLEPREARS